jgi:transposase
LTESEILLGLPEYQINEIEREGKQARIRARYMGSVQCKHCKSPLLRSKGLFRRSLRHYDLGGRPCHLQVEGRKYLCKQCGRQFRQILPGIGPYTQATLGYQRLIFEQHLDGINRSQLGRRQGIGAATVNRYFHAGLKLQFGEFHNLRCPTVLGIDEHFFTRKQGYATTFCDLKNHKIYDVVLGRSEAALESYLLKLQGRDQVRVVCIDLSSSYRALIRKYFPNAMIVADRFHVIRLVNQHFMAFWRLLDPVGSNNRGLLKLMRRHQQNLNADQRQKLDAYLAKHPALAEVYNLKQDLCQLLLNKGCNQHKCKALIPRFLDLIDKLRYSNLPQLATLGQTLHHWQQEIARMWRFSRNNGITEGFHTKMELISRLAYGFRNFLYYRLRVKVLCC